jgi:hypothetical protein
MAPAVQRDQAPPKGITTAAKDLGEVQGWAQDAQRSQKVVTIQGVVGLDLSRQADLVEAIKALTDALPAVRANVSPFAAPLADLRLALEKVKESERALKAATTPMQESDARQVLADGRSAVGRALTKLKAIKAVKQAILRNVATLEGNMASASGWVGLINGLSQTISDIEGLDTDQRIEPVSVERVLFVLQSFLALNDPAAPAPTGAKAATMRFQLGSIQADFSSVFGSSAQFGLFIDYVDLLVRQIDARAAMTKAGAAPKGQVPGEADARSYFTKLKKASNDDLFDAFTTFMQAFFFHKEVASIGELTRSNDALMAAPSSISGIRGLVCTGYATLGAEFMALAGATKGEFIVAFRASDDQLLTEGAIDSGHAIAKFSRNGQDRWVSNHLVVTSEDGGIGPDAVAWEHSDFPLIKAKGATLSAAADAIIGELAKARAAAKARKAKGTKQPRAKAKR